jgi:hypothetical protein
MLAPLGTRKYLWSVLTGTSYYRKWTKIDVIYICAQVSYTVSENKEDGSSLN